MNSLSNEELVKLYQGGDKKALDILIENNKKIVYKLANKFNQVSSIKRVELEDLIQEGTIGLIVAAQKYNFDINKKAKFITYAVHYIKRYIQRCLNGRSEKEVKNNDLYNSTTSLSTPIDGESSSELIDFIEGVDYSYENIEDKVLLSNLKLELDSIMIEKLTLLEREIIRSRFCWDCGTMTYDELGEIHGYCRERIRQIENKALRILKKSEWSKVSGEKYMSELCGVIFKHTDSDTTKAAIHWSSEMDELEMLMQHYGSK